MTLTGRGVLLWLGGFFAVVMAINAVFITLSVKTFRGEDEQLPYLQGIAYNHTLALRAAQKALDWHAEISASRLTPAMVRIAVVLRRPDGRPLDGLKLEGELRHPADENRDIALAFKSVGGGLYQADAPAGGRGVRDVIVHADDGTPFEAQRRLWLP